MGRFLPQLLAVVPAALLIAGCTATPPAEPDNLCSIFQEKDSWYVAAHAVHNKYGVPIPTAMAILYQDSRFDPEDPRPMQWFLFIPYGRAEIPQGLPDLPPGYVHVSPELWERYADEAGAMFASPEDFADALDFIGWHMQLAHQVNGIAYGDTYNQLLNFHEGVQGFAAGSYENKDWLIKAAQEAARRAETYRSQLLKCDLY